MKNEKNNNAIARRVQEKKLKTRFTSCDAPQPLATRRANLHIRTHIRGIDSFSTLSSRRLFSPHLTHETLRSAHPGLQKSTGRRR